jgi:signal recognition particle subunit SRP72
LYNTACIYIAKGQWHKAERLLIRARDECQRSLKEQGYNEEEIEQELIPILAQLAFVYQQQSKHKMAAEYYHMILNTNLAEDTIRSIVLNNTVAQQRPTRKLLPVQSRQLQLAADTKVENKLFMSQRRLLAANRAIMQLGLKKVGNVYGK